MPKKDPVKDHIKQTDKDSLEKASETLREYLVDKSKNNDMPNNLKELQREYMKFCKRHRDEDASEYMQIIDDVVNRINE